MLNSLTTQLRQTISLSGPQVAEAVTALIDEQVPVDIKAEFLIALAQKGETVQEIEAFARELIQRAILPPLAPDLRQREILDVCGTGGDRLGTFNISTTVAFVVASAGIAVAKHGNRAITSQSGSADVLEELNVPIDLSPEQAAAALREHNFAFFFAPHYHPSFKHIGPARKRCAERGQRTIFNFLGPLLNPARPTAQLIGVPSPALCEPIGLVLKALGVRRGMVVSGRVDQHWADELSIFGENVIAEFYQDRAFLVGSTTLQGFHFQPATSEDLRGGDRRSNASILRDILSGRDRSPRRDAVLLNASAALVVAGRVRSMVEGWDLASELVDSGQATAKLLSVTRPC